MVQVVEKSLHQIIDELMNCIAGTLSLVVSLIVSN